jgi:kynurenine formamidase
MRRVTLPTILSALLVGICAGYAQTPTWTFPADNARCPSKWGAGDERGAANHMGSKSVLNAVKLIKSGEVIELGHPLNSKIPLGARNFELYTKPNTPSVGSNHFSYNEELVVAEMGQVGTDLDGLAHIMHDGSLYNCFKASDIATSAGFTKLGVEKVGALITRGVLIDVAGYKGVDILGDTYEITVADVEGALKKENLTLQPGDAVIIHTGWGKLWDKDNVRYGKSNPGIGLKAAEWLIATDPMLLGSDVPPVEVRPNPDPLLAGQIHQLAQVVNGIHFLENLKLDELAAKGAYEFAFMLQPLKLQGASGSTVSPIAVR